MMNNKAASTIKQIILTTTIKNDAVLVAVIIITIIITIIISMIIII